MSDNPVGMSPSEWIQHVRAKHGVGGLYSVPRSSVDEYIAKLPEVLRAAAAPVWNERYKKNATEVYDELMAQYLAGVTPVLLPEEKAVTDSTYFAILPTRDFNGYAGFTPRGDRVIILHEGLGYTLQYWSHWYLRLTLDHGGRDYLAANQPALEYALHYIQRIWDGEPMYTTLPDIYPTTEDSWRLSESLALSAIAFVLGHEIGHVLLQHPPYTSDHSRNHALEFEADRVGLSIAVRHSLAKTRWLNGDTYDSKFMLYGPLFAVAVMSLFGDSESLSHPSPTQRRQHLLGAYPAVFSDIFGSNARRVISGIDDDLFAILQQNSANLLRKFAEYRDAMLDAGITFTKAENSWILTELAGAA